MRLIKAAIESYWKHSLHISTILVRLVKLISVISLAHKSQENVKDVSSLYKANMKLNLRVHQGCTRNLMFCFSCLQKFHSCKCQQVLTWKLLKREQAAKKLKLSPPVSLFQATTLEDVTFILPFLIALYKVIFKLGKSEITSKSNRV